MSNNKNINNNTINDYKQYDNEEFISLEEKKIKLMEYKERRLNKLALNDLKNPDFKNYTERHFAVAKEQHNKQKSLANRNCMLMPSIRDKLLEENSKIYDNKITVPNNNKTDIENIIIYFKNPVEHNQSISASKEVKDVYMPRDFMEHTKNFETMSSFGNKSNMTCGEYIRFHQEQGSVDNTKTAQSLIFSHEGEIQKAFDISHRQMLETHKKERATMTDENCDVINAQHKFEVDLFNYKEKNILKPVELQDDKQSLQDSYVKFQEKNLVQNQKNAEQSMHEETQQNDMVVKAKKKSPYPITTIKDGIKSTTYRIWIDSVKDSEDKIQKTQTKPKNEQQKSIIDKIKGLRFKL